MFLCVKSVKCRECKEVINHVNFELNKSTEILEDRIIDPSIYDLNWGRCLIF